MSQKRLIATVGGTAACAFGIGYFMQLDDARDAHRRALESGSFQQAVLEPDTGLGDLPLDLQDIVLTSAPAEKANLGLKTSGLQLTSLGNQIQPDGHAPKAVDKLACEVSASATTSAQALVDLAVSAPCYANERVMIHHNGMMFTETTGDNGAVNVSIPALSKNAIFVVEFANGKGAVATTKVSSLEEYDRVVVQWAGNNEFQVHAREFGAGYGDIGHVWYGVGLGDQIAAQADSGFVIRLGDISTLFPKLAEIYTFPTGLAQKSGTVALSVETEVTSANCGRDISAQSLELRGGSSLSTRDLVLSMPDCSAVGDFLVLNNLVDDLKIAAR